MRAETWLHNVWLGVSHSYLKHSRDLSTINKGGQGGSIKLGQFYVVIKNGAALCRGPLSREGTLKPLEYLQRLDSYGVAWTSFTEQYLDSTGMFRDAVIAILAPIAKQEHARLSERVVAGLRRAKREGRVLGRKRIILDREKIRAMHAAGESVRAIAAKIGISKSLVSNILTSQPVPICDESEHVCDDACRSYGCKQALFFREDRL